jgi:hypothetical protein
MRFWRDAMTAFSAEKRRQPDFETATDEELAGYKARFWHRHGDADSNSMA